MNPQYQPGDRVIITPKGLAPPFAAEVIRDIGSTLIEVVCATGRVFPARSQVRPMSQSLSSSDSPAIRREYSGIMQQRLEKQ